MQQDGVRATLGASKRSAPWTTELSEYDGATDIEFNPKKSANCQACSCALYCTMSRNKKLDVLREPDSFIRIVGRLAQTHAYY